MLTSPCEMGLDCPYCLEDGCDIICSYPKLAEDTTEYDVLPDVRDASCGICKPGTQLYDLINVYYEDEHVQKVVDKALMNPSIMDLREGEE